MKESPLTREDFLGLCQTRKLYYSEIFSLLEHVNFGRFLIRMCLLQPDLSVSFGKKGVMEPMQEEKGLF